MICKFIAHFYCQSIVNSQPFLTVYFLLNFLFLEFILKYTKILRVNISVARVCNIRWTRYLNSEKRLWRRDALSNLQSSLA